MKSVLTSIRPKWCELIASGKKTIVVYKTCPKIETPFKDYIYCTLDGGVKGDRFMIDGKVSRAVCGMVIGEFVCDCIKTYPADDFVGAEDLDGTIITEPKNGEFAYWIPEEKEICLPYHEIRTYGNGKPLYGWHISELKIYDKPRELGEFSSFCKEKESETHCANCEHYLFDNDDLNGYRRWCGVYRRKPITRPPQSWCYVEELQ